MLTDYNLYTNMCDEKCWELTNHITGALNALLNTQRRITDSHVGTRCEGHLNACTVSDIEHSFTHFSTEKIK